MNGRNYEGNVIKRLVKLSRDKTRSGDNSVVQSRCGNIKRLLIRSNILSKHSGNCSTVAVEHELISYYFYRVVVLYVQACEKVNNFIAFVSSVVIKTQAHEVLAEDFDPGQEYQLFLYSNCDCVAKSSISRITESTHSYCRHYSVTCRERKYCTVENTQTLTGVVTLACECLTPIAPRETDTLMALSEIYGFRKR